QLIERGEVDITEGARAAGITDTPRLVTVTPEEAAALTRYEQTGDVTQLRGVRMEAAREFLEGGAIARTTEDVTPTRQELEAISRYLRTGDVKELENVRPELGVRAVASRPEQPPRVELKGHDRATEHINRARDLADRIGVTRDIERLSAEGLTADQVGRRLAGALDAIDRITRANDPNANTRALERGRA